MLHELPENSVTSMNMWACPNDFMREFTAKFSQFLEISGTDLEHDEFYLPGAVGDLVVEQRATVRVLPTSAKWMGVTYRDDILRVREGIRVLIESGVYPQRLWEDAS